MTAGKGRIAAPPLDSAALKRLAMRYVGRYATSRSRLRAYLHRKVTERGWIDDAAPDIAAVVESIAAAGMIDDAAFAQSRAAAMERRGMGPRRLSLALRADGIEEEDSAPARREAESGAWRSAVRFAKRRRIGPFASAVADPGMRMRQFAMMMRAGHSPDIARKLVETAPGDLPVCEND